MRSKFLLLISVLISFFILTGCGSSSSVSTGVYKDAGVVSGLQYQTATQSGVTDAQGRFKYLDGEQVTFSVSNVTLGQAKGAAVVTPFDLVGITPPRSSLGILFNNPQSKKFQEAVNISVFLQTLDEDGQASNGIQIPAIVHSVVATIPFNFKLTYGREGQGDPTLFTDSAQLQLFIARCRNAGAWGGFKPIKLANRAVYNLYAGLGITPKVFLKNVATQPDGSTERYSYDRFGQLTSTLQYDADGHLTLQKSVTYDAEGNITVSDILEVDTQLRHTVRYAFDANGNVIHISTTSQTGVDEATFTYDSNGLVTQRTDLSEGVFASKTVYTFNAYGKLASQKYYNGSNQLQHTYEFNYNTDLFETSFHYTEANSGRNYSRFNFYNDKNEIVQQTLTVGQLEYIYTYAYDNLGNVSTVFTHLNNELIEKTFNEWDANGLILRAVKYGANEQLDNTSVYTYDNNGNLIQKVISRLSSSLSTAYSYTEQTGWGELFNNFLSSPF